MFANMKLIVAVAVAIACVATSASPMADNHNKDKDHYKGDDYYNEENKSDVDINNISVKQAVDQCSGNKLSCCEELKPINDETKAGLNLENLIGLEDTLGGQCADIEVIGVLDDVLSDHCNQSPACCSGDVKTEEGSFSLIQIGCIPLNGAL